MPDMGSSGPYRGASGDVSEGSIRTAHDDGVAGEAERYTTRPASMLRA
jgi:hypothetical protein